MPNKKRALRTAPFKMPAERGPFSFHQGKEGKK
jgi:hypothetical protein